MMFVYQRVTGHSTDSTGQWLITLDLQYTVATGDSPGSPDIRFYR